MVSQETETITVGKGLIKKIENVIDIALEYEDGTQRKLPITGEVGELFACNKLSLELVTDPRLAGYDAIDKDGLKVQIKTRRSESRGLPSDKGRISRFSNHKYDYAILVLLDHKFGLQEIWRAEYNKLNPIVEKYKKRDPHLWEFKKIGRKIFSKNC